MPKVIYGDYVLFSRHMAECEDCERMRECYDQNMSNSQGDKYTCTFCTECLGESRVALIGEKEQEKIDEARQLIARENGKKRWANISPVERSKQMKEVSKNSPVNKKKS